VEQLTPLQAAVAAPAKKIIHRGGVHRLPRNPARAVWLAATHAHQPPLTTLRPTAVLRYEREGLRRSVDAVIVVQQHGHPHVLLLQVTKCPMAAQKTSAAPSESELLKSSRPAAPPQRRCKVHQLAAVLAPRPISAAACAPPLTRPAACPHRDQSSVIATSLSCLEASSNRERMVRAWGAANSIESHIHRGFPGALNFSNDAVAASPLRGRRLAER
jgi:hypothetical protein